MMWKYGQMYERMVLEEMWIIVAFVCAALSCVTSCLCIKFVNRSRFLSFWTTIFTSLSGKLIDISYRGIDTHSNYKAILPLNMRSKKEMSVTIIIVTGSSQKSCYF